MRSRGLPGPTPRPSIPAGRRPHSPTIVGTPDGGREAGLTVTAVRLRAGPELAGPSPERGCNRWGLARGGQPRGPRAPLPAWETPPRSPPGCHGDAVTPRPGEPAEQPGRGTGRLAGRSGRRALLVYRVFRNEAKRTTKVLHGLLHVFALVIALVGLVAVFDYHRKKGYADLYSLHSWCGILVFVLYFVQWLVGFSFFLFPGAPFSLRSRYRPQHIFFGATIFLLSVGTALLGLKEALLFNLGDKYSAFEPEGVLANVLGLLLACFGGAVLYILTRADWKRPSQAEEQALSMDFKTLTEGDSPGSQ
nr:transmembrane ascorbate-dependent reductase CYB561 isoform X1 [Macaca fascicularis]